MDKHKLARVLAAATAIAIPAEGLRQVALSAPLHSFKKAASRVVSFWKIVLRPNRSSGSFFKRPFSSSDPIVHNAYRNPVRFGYFRPSRTVAAGINNGSVPVLRLSVGPCAVIRVIAKRIVFTFYRKIISITRGQRPFVEGFKFKPRIANRNPLAAVCFVGCISAPAKHVAPAVMDSCPFHPVRCRPSPNSRSGTLAAAGNAFTVAQIRANNYTLCSAGASTQPQSSTSWRISRFLNYQPLTKFISSHIDKSWIFHFITPRLQA